MSDTHTHFPLVALYGHSVFSRDQIGYPLRTNSPLLSVHAFHQWLDNPRKYSERRERDNEATHREFPTAFAGVV